MRIKRFNDALARIAADIGEVTSYLWDRGWAERNAGNLSVDVTDAVDGTVLDAGEPPHQPETITSPELARRTFLVTATGSRLRDVGTMPEHTLLLARVSDALDGYHVLWGGAGRQDGERRATSEFVSHLKIHGFLLGKGLPHRAVLHTHPNHLVALSHMESLLNERDLNRLLWSMHPEMKVFVPEGVGLAPYRLPGSEALADATLGALGDHRVVLWEKHGVVAVGRDVAEAFDLIDTVNKSAEIFFLCRGAGVRPQGLTPDQVEELEAVYVRRERKP